LTTVFAIGLVTCGLACVFLYAGSPNQQWFKARPFSFKTAIIGCISLCTVATFCFSQTFSVAAAIFTTFTFSMLGLSLVPLITRWEKPLTAPRGNKSTLSRAQGSHASPPLWWLKSIGALVLGLPLGLFTSALITFAIFDNTPLDVKTQHLMWWIVPIWLTLIALIYFSKRPLRIFTAIALLTFAEYLAIQALI
jgi:hypothetical protein